MSLSSHSDKANEKNQRPVIYSARKTRELEKENPRNTHLGVSNQSKCLGKVNGNSHQKANRVQSRGHSNATGSKSHLVAAGDLLPSTSVSSTSNDQRAQRDGRRDGKADLEENLQQFGRNIGNYIRDRHSRPGNRVPVHELNEELRKANMAMKQKGGGTQIGRLWKLFKLVEGRKHFNAITIDSYEEITKNKRITDNAEESPIQRPTVIMNSAGVSPKRHTDEEIQILDEEQMDWSSIPCDAQDLWIVEDNQDASFQQLDSQLAEVFDEEPQDDGETAYDLSIQNVGQTYAIETKTMFEELYDY